MAAMTLERRRNDIIKTIRKTTDTNFLDKIASLLNYKAVNEPQAYKKALKLIKNFTNIRKWGRDIPNR